MSDTSPKLDKAAVVEEEIVPEPVVTPPAVPVAEVVTAPQQHAMTNIPQSTPVVVEVEPAPETATLSWVAFGVTVFGFFNALAAIAGIILSIIALTRHEKPRWISLTSLIVGAGFLILKMFLVIVLLVVLIASGVISEASGSGLPEMVFTP